MIASLDKTILLILLALLFFFSPFSPFSYFFVPRCCQNWRREEGELGTITEERELGENLTISHFSFFLFPVLVPRSPVSGNILNPSLAREALYSSLRKQPILLSLYVTLRRPCWRSRTKAFLSSRY